jgi:hypothetical protein
MLLLLMNLLFTQSETRNDTLISRGILLVCVFKKSRSCAHHLEQAPSGRVVLLIALEVFGEVIDSLGQKRDLHFRRTSVLFMGFGFLDNRCFFLQSQHLLIDP